MGLKANPKYEKRVFEEFLAMTNLFKKMYPNVQIEPPRGRIKSNKSLRTKIENLEIERLCILNAIEGITFEEKIYLFNAIFKMMDYKDQKAIRDIMFGKLENLDNIRKIIKQESVPEKAKTALLRITKTR